MKVLAFLQNQWFSDPEKVRAILARRPEARQRIITYGLFAGCRTGRVLKDGLGGEWCRKIVWEEASPEIGGEASSSFPADRLHILAAIERTKPTAIIALGKIAADAVLHEEAHIRDLVQHGITILTGPHPTARGIDALGFLCNVRVVLDTIEANERRALA